MPTGQRPAEPGWVLALLCTALLAVQAFAIVALPISANASGDLTSASYRLRGPNTNAASAARLSSPGPRLSGGGISLGQPEAVGPSGSLADLTTTLPGFWPQVAGELPSLEIDGDGLPSYLDLDDDGDGLPDSVETDSGDFLSASDTGSDPVDPDSDDDGYGDGLEVAAQTDPNEAGSFPTLPSIPVLGPIAIAGLAGCLVLAGAVAASRRKEDEA